MSTAFITASNVVYPGQCCPIKSNSIETPPCMIGICPQSDHWAAPKCHYWSSSSRNRSVVPEMTPVWSASLSTCLHNGVRKRSGTPRPMLPRNYRGLSKHEPVQDGEILLKVIASTQRSQPSARVPEETFTNPAT